MPIDQMMVTITRPIEEAVNSVPGLEHCALHHQPRLRRNRSVLRLERGHASAPCSCVNAALARVQTDLPPTAKCHGQPPDFRRFPIIGYSLTSDTVPQTSCGRWRPTRSSRG